MVDSLDLTWARMDADNCVFRVVRMQPTAQKPAGAQPQDIRRVAGQLVERHKRFGDDIKALYDRLDATPSGSRVRLREIF